MWEKDERFTGFNVDLEKLAEHVVNYAKENGFEYRVNKDPTAPPSWFQIQRARMKIKEECDMLEEEIISKRVTYEHAHTLYVSSRIGFATPYLSYIAKIDPALTSGPIVTLIKDVTGLLIYFIGYGHLLSLHRRVTCLMTLSVFPFLTQLR